jgi:REP element-mobilizing transposase RayT
MARIARAVAPGIPHHVTQRGNRRQQTFFNDQDYQAYFEKDGARIYGREDFHLSSRKYHH